MLSNRVLVPIPLLHRVQKVSRSSIVSQVGPAKRPKRPKRTLTDELKWPEKALRVAAGGGTAPSQCKQLLQKGFICHYTVALQQN